MTADGSVSVFCGPPARVPVTALDPAPGAPPPAPGGPLPAAPGAAPLLPTGPCPVCPRLAQEFEPWRQAAYWKAMHDRARQREAVLQQENEQLRAQLRLREHQLFGPKTETSTAATRATATTRPDSSPRRRRGQQPGHPGPRRRDYAHLPTIPEDRDLPGDQGG